MVLGVFGAFANLWRGFWSLWVRDLAVANPEAAYAGVVADLKTKREKLLQAASAVIGQRDRTQGEFDTVSADLAKTERELAGAVTRNLKEAGALLLQKKNRLAARKAELEATLLHLNKDADRVKRDLRTFSAEILKVKEEAVTNVARLRSAQATSHINAMLDGLSVNSASQMLDSIRESIGTEVAKSNLQRELRDGDINDQLAQAREVGETAAAEDEFSKLRQQFEASQGTASVSTGASSDTGSDPGKSV
ncbi:MAG: PspA/IM30 family protein [Patescibacteria group bacterium]